MKIRSIMKKMCFVDNYFYGLAHCTCFQDAFQSPRGPEMPLMQQISLRCRGEAGWRIQISQSLLQML